MDTGGITLYCWHSSIPVLCLGVMGLRKSDRFTIASFFYGLFLLFYISLNNVFIEIRAQMGFLLLLMPAALGGVERILHAEAKLDGTLENDAKPTA